jgi:PBSX family phage terminase large subunit
MALGIGQFMGASHRAYNSKMARLNIYDGAVRSGKTVTAIMRWAKWLVEDAPPGTLMLSGKTERTVKQNMIDPLLEIFPKKYIHYSAGNHELNFLGRKHIIVGANDERAEAKIRGITLAGCLADEVTLWAESFFKMTLSRMSVKGAAFLGTTNPDSPVHWLNTEYLQRADELGLQRHIFRLTKEDNPYLDEEYVASIMKEYTGLWRKRYIEGQWVVAEGAIYDMFDPEIHSVDWDVIPRGKWNAVGIDYGTTNPTVFLALTQLEDGRILVHDEWRHDSKKAGHQLTMKEHSVAFFNWKQGLKKKHADTHPNMPGMAKLERTAVDPSANAFVLQLWKDGERTVKAANNDVNAGIMEVGSLLQRNALLFHAPTTKITMEEIAGYAWDPDATLKGEDKPMKVADHGPDALRYIIRETRMRWKPMLAGLGM